MTLKVLHLSDLHLSAKNAQDVAIVRDALVDRLKTEVAQRGSPDLVVFSGDLVNAGTSVDEFETAYKSFVLPTLSAANVSENKFVIVPGNHDIDREAVRSEPELESGYKHSLTDRNRLNAFIDKHKSKSSHHFARLANYFAFLNQHSFAPIITDSPYFTTHRISADGLSIGISCLNTAWRTTGEADDIDYGQLLLGERSIRNSLLDLADCDLKIAVFHHPLKCLKSFDQSDCKSLLLKEFDLLMTGHCHEQRPELITATSGRAILSESGALYVNRQYFNGFCWISFEKQLGRAEFNVWRYEDENARNVFEPANNVADNGFFSIQLSSPEELKRYIGVEAACSALKPIIEELADEQMLSHFTETAAPKTFAEIYVAAHIRDRSQHQQRADAKSVEITEDEILASTLPYIIYGPRESGKTTLAYRLCLRSIEECKRIPLYVDLAAIKPGSSSIEKAIKRFAGSAMNSIDLVTDLDQGKLRIIFDNYAIPQANPQSRKRKLAMVADFIETHPRTQYILLADESAIEASRMAKPDRFEIDHKTAYLQPMKRRAIRELSRKWLEPTGLHSAQNVKAVLEKIRSLNLPGTAQVVSMVLWTIEREKSLGPVNEASLLQRFVEANLNRSDPSDVERGSIDFLIKETFLSDLAFRMKERDTLYIPKNELLRDALGFFEARSWRYDASRFVEELIKSGTLMQTSDDDTQDVAFRFRCLAEYFTASRLEGDASIVPRLFQEDKILNYIRELDILTGLTRSDASLLDRVLNAIDTHQQVNGIDPLNEVRHFLSMKMRHPQAQEIAAQMSFDVREADATDAEIDQLVEEMEEVTAPVQSESKDDADRKIDPEQRYFLFTLLLSKIVRNNELVDNEALKLRALNRAIDAWCYFSVGVWKRFDELADGTGPTKLQEKFSSFSDREKAFIEFMSKCIVPSVLTSIAQDALGTDKLLLLIYKSYSETQPSLIFRRLLLLQIMLYLGFSAAKCPPETIQKAQSFIRDTKHQPTLLLLTLSLFASFMNPFLGDTNRRILEDLMAEISVAQNEQGWSVAQKNQAKSSILPRLQKLRKKYEVDETGDEATKP